MHTNQSVLFFFLVTSISICFWCCNQKYNIPFHVQFSRSNLLYRMAKDAFNELFDAHKRTWIEKYYNRTQYICSDKVYSFLHVRLIHTDLMIKSKVIWKLSQWIDDVCIACKITERQFGAMIFISDKTNNNCLKNVCQFKIWFELVYDYVIR